MEIPAQFLQAVKNADNSVTLNFYQGKALGTAYLVYSFIMTSTDATALNTNVIAGAAGANQNFLYPQLNPFATPGANGGQTAGSGLTLPMGQYANGQ